MSLIELCWTPLLETLYMVALSTLLASLLGIPLGVFLFVTRHPLLTPSPLLHRISDSITNILRSIPFIILLIALIPITRFLVGTSIGTTASIVPLTIAAIPFVARVIDNALDERPFGLLEAGLAMGASTWQIVRFMLLPESLAAIIHGITLTMINLVAYSAMAGAIGGGGLGDLAIRYGYQRFDSQVMLATIVILVLLVQIIQSLGDYCAHRVQRLAQR